MTKRSVVNTLIISLIILGESTSISLDKDIGLFRKTN